jgi:phosphopantothenoylcysteine synthetase/decarboxylase
MLVGMAQASGVLSVVVSGAAPAADVSTLVEQALERGWTVQVIATPSALAFFDAAEIEAITGSPVRSRHRAPGAPRSRVPDAIVVAPATFNLINQWALGVADSYALAVLAEQTGMGLPIVALPAVSAPLASRPQFARSLRALRGEGVSVLLGPGAAAPPGSGEGTFPWHLALDEAYSMTGLGGLP